MHQEQKSALPAVKSFAATGRGRMLMKFINSPLKAKELEKRKKLQGCTMSRKFNLPISCEQNVFETKNHTKTTLSVSNTSIKDKRSGEDHCNGPSYPCASKKTYTDNSNNENQGGHLDTTELEVNGNRSNNMKQASNITEQSENQKTAISNDKPAGVVSNNVNKFYNGNEAVWDDWEKSVVVEGSCSDDEDLEELAVVGDNDDINDVLVQQFVTALQDEPKNAGATAFDRKITATRVQKVSKLKSTANAETPGATLNPPRRLNRWGTLESTSLTEISGWGEVNGASLNCYNDGVSIWDSSNLCSKDSTNHPSNTPLNSSQQVCFS